MQQPDQPKRANITKRCHYVPRMLTKRFVGQDGKLFFFSKSQASRGIVPISPGDLFVESHLYNQVADGGGWNPEVEQWLCGVEDAASPVLDKIAHAVRSGSLPLLSTKEREAWDDFFVTQYARTPDTQKRVSQEAAAARLSQILDDLHTQYPGHEHDKHGVQTEADRSGIIRDARIAALTRPMPRIRGLFGSRGLTFALIPRPSKAFVIGSAPLARMFDLGATARLVEMWLPIAPDIAVGPGSAHEAETLVPLHDSQLVRRFNRAVFAQSTVVASASPKLLDSLIASR